jgi:hypothetical protein
MRILVGDRAKDEELIDLELVDAQFQYGLLFGIHLRTLAITYITSKA